MGPSYMYMLHQKSEGRAKQGTVSGATAPLMRNNFLVVNANWEKRLAIKAAAGDPEGIFTPAALQVGCF
jgi:hypothetical protein